MRIRRGYSFDTPLFEVVGVTELVLDSDISGRLLRELYLECFGTFLRLQVELDSKLGSSDMTVEGTTRTL